MNGPLTEFSHLNVCGLASQFQADRLSMEATRSKLEAQAAKGRSDREEVMQTTLGWIAEMARAIPKAETNGVRA